MKKLSSSLFLLLLIFLANALPRAGSELYKTFYTWDENKRLKWSDFQGEPIANAAEAAMTASSVEFSYYVKGNQIGWTVMAKYFPKLSWSRKEDQSKYILQHEQLHFDITELYARLFRQRLAENVKSAKDVSRLKAIGKQIMDEWAHEENEYDRETKHSLNEEKQDEWNANIAERLEQLKEYASK
jgi:hypothetical protein